MQLVRGRVRQLVNPVQPEPKLRLQVPKAVLVLLPAAIKVNRPVESALNYDPAAGLVLLIANHREGIAKARFRQQLVDDAS